MRYDRNQPPTRRRRRRSNPFPIFRDTIKAEFNTGQGSGAFTFSAATLLPSLDVNEVRERRVIIQRIIFERMPAEFTDQLLVQLQTSSYYGTGDSTESFKLASSINPTRYELDFLKLGKVAPYVLRPCDISQTNSVLRVQVSSDADTLSLYGRITTVVRVMPQNSVAISWFT